MRGLLRGWVLVVASAVVVAGVLGGCGGGGGVSVGSAVTGFGPGVASINNSFAALNSDALSDPSALRAVALAHLDDKNADRRYAAVYSLALTALPGKGSAQLGRLLGSGDPSERLLAAGSLISIGDTAAIPVLIAALSSDDQVAYFDPGEFAYEFARAELLYFTAQNFGLRAAVGPAAIAATRPAWQRWWNAQRRSLRFDFDARRYTT